jgi:DNA topoisomerase-1
MSESDKKKPSKKSKKLVIVESPAKAKTINKYLGTDYVVTASMGHVRDLPAKKFGVDVEKGFEPTYEISPTRKKLVGELKKHAEKASEIYLATDLDREGEAIAWHLASALGIDETEAKRVMFNEITKKAIQQAFEHPKSLDLDKVNAQQARRILDRIVGYQLSPLLWKKIAKNLSAGRVQSVAVRLIVDREEDIEKFIPEEYWTITAILHAGKDPASARKSFSDFMEAHKEGIDRDKLADLFQRHHLIKADITHVDGKSFKATTKEDTDQILSALQHGTFQISELQKKVKQEKPPAPFTTAALQQQAATRLKFAAERTMRIAQQLYEGVEMGSEGAVALITYMRTDSTHLSSEAIQSVRGLIGSEYGNEYLPEKPNFYASGKSAQEAHEAVRPTDVTIKPELAKQFLNPDQFKLYSLIWKRFVACQMVPAKWDVTEAIISAAGKSSDKQLFATFKTVGRILSFPGFLRILPERMEGADNQLPPLNEKQMLDLVNLDGSQHFTQPPPRYNEASLVRSLETQGIGRPSTYASIISTIQDRGYVKKEEGKFFPTDLGRVVTKQLVEHFPHIMDVKFTSHMEEQLDKIEEAHLDWVSVLNEFYDPFKQSLEQATANMKKQAIESEYACDLCGKPMVYKWTKSGRFLGCSGYPECKNTMRVDDDGKLKAAPKTTDHQCPLCEKPMIIRQSRFGSFLGCSGYPECKSTIPCNEEGNPLKKVKPEELNMTCPECGKPLAAKRFRGGSFAACTGYPDCKHTEPLPKDIAIDWPERKTQLTDIKCEKCGAPMAVRLSKRGPFLGCSAFPKCRSIQKVPPEMKEALAVKKSEKTQEN